MASLLIVDGDRNFGQAVAIALRLDGIAVTTASSVEEATSLLPGAFCTCVVDCLLPDADAFIARLASERNVRVVATGVHPELLGSMARRHPGVGMLPKPFRTSELRPWLPRGSPAEAP
jgi:DNA-binding response OmpR family regulator